MEIAGLSGIYSDPRHVIAYEDGEVRQEFSLCFHARPLRGQPRTSAESREARWVSPDSLRDLKIHPSMRLRIDHALKQEPEPYPRLGRVSEVGRMVAWRRRRRHLSLTLDGSLRTGLTP